MRAGRVATIAGVGLILAASAMAHADAITMQMGGLITYSDHPSLTGMNVGDAWSVTYTFASNALDQASDPDWGQYFENSLSLTVAGQVVAVCYLGSIDVGNNVTDWYDPASGPYDYYNVRASLCPFNGQGWPALGVGGEDQHASILSGDSLPLRPLPLGVFESFGFSIWDALDGAFHVEGSVTYWTPVATADFDQDGDVDLADFPLFHACFNGPNRPPGVSTSQCYAADLDNDLDVDLSDFAIFQGCFNGPNNPPRCQ